MRSLTVDEQKFATKHHNLVYTFLNKKHLNRDKYYDIVIFGFLHAVVSYHDFERLRQYSFTTIAWKRMETAYSNSCRARFAQIRLLENTAISLDQPINGYDDVTIGDTVAYDAHIHENIECEELLTEILTPLTDFQSEIVKLRILGLTTPQIAIKLGKNHTTIYRHISAIRQINAALQG